MDYKIEGNGKTLVFIHGLSDDLQYWEGMAHALKKDYQILRINLRGHGGSELGSEEISIDTYADDLNSLLDELDIQKVNLIGFSLGGAVALDFTVKYPNKVNSLVAMSTFYKMDDNLDDICNQWKHALEIGFDEFYDMIIPKILCPDVITENKAELEYMKVLGSEDANIEAYIKAIDACLKFDIENELPKINCPTLILASKYDEISKLELQKELESKIKNSKLIVFDNVRHNLLVGNTDEITAILRDFIK